MNWFHEVNELYDGTLHKLLLFFYLPDISKNGTVIFRESMKQEERLSFVDEMEK